MAPPPPPARGAHRAQLPLLLRTVAATLLLCLDGRAGAQTTCYYSTYYSVYPVSAGDILYADWSDGTIIGVGAECGGATYCEASYGSHACEGWRIRCNNDEVVHVQFSDGKFNTESGYDYVQLYDGDQTTSYGDPTMPYHSRFAGSSDPSPIHLTGSSRTMTVVWIRMAPSHEPAGRQRRSASTRRGARLGSTGTVRPHRPRVLPAPAGSTGRTGAIRTVIAQTARRASAARPTARPARTAPLGKPPRQVVPHVSTAPRGSIWK